jgi:uncharacterized membrane protein YhaH (DUF805 family)
VTIHREVVVPQEKKPNSSPVVVAIWIYVALAVPIALLFVRRGRDLPFTDGDVFLFVVPLLLASCVEILTSTAERKIVNQRRQVPPALIVNFLFLLVAAFFLLRAPMNGTGSAPWYEVAIFVLAIVYSIAGHGLAADLDLVDIPQYSSLEFAQFGRSLLTGLSEAFGAWWLYLRSQRH